MFHALRGRKNSCRQGLATPLDKSRAFRAASKLRVFMKKEKAEGVAATGVLSLDFPIISAASHTQAHDNFKGGFTEGEGIR